MISLARTDGARKTILELCTHTPLKSGNTIDLYTTFLWEALCSEVAKLQVQRHERGQLARLPLAVSREKESPGTPDGARGLATVSRKAESFPGDAQWRRRESNPRLPEGLSPSSEVFSSERSLNHITQHHVDSTERSNVAASPLPPLSAEVAEYRRKVPPQEGCRACAGSFKRVRQACLYHSIGAAVAEVRELRARVAGLPFSAQGSKGGEA